MTKEHYLAELKKRLRRLPQAEFDDAINYFEEYFEERGPEQEAQVIEELGRPKEAAAELLARLLDDELEDDYSKTGRPRTLWIALLALAAVPVGIPALLLLCIALLTFIMMGFAGILTILALLIAVFVIGWAMLTLSFQILSQSFSAFLILLGGGLIGLALGLLLITCFIWLIGLAISGLSRLIQRFIRKGGQSYV